MDVFLNIADCPEPIEDEELLSATIPGGNGIQTSGKVECAIRCNRNPSCGAWNLEVSSNMCWLKTAASPMESKEGWLYARRCNENINNESEFSYHRQ